MGISVGGFVLQSFENAGEEAQAIAVVDENGDVVAPYRAAVATDAVMSGATALTPKYANVDVVSSGDNTLVGAVTAKKIRVLSICLFPSGAVDAFIRDDTAGTPVNLLGGTRKIKFDNSGAAGVRDFILPFNPLGWFETPAGEGLQLNLSAGVGVAGCLTYVEV